MLQIGFKCCGALDYAFAQGIVHRDIKPANIMIVQGTDVKIADFGAAFLRKSQAVQTAAMGSPFYMSPEQIEGKELTCTATCTRSAWCSTSCSPASGRSSPTTSRRW